MKKVLFSLFLLANARADFSEDVLPLVARGTVIVGGYGVGAFLAGKGIYKISDKLQANYFKTAQGLKAYAWMRGIYLLSLVPHTVLNLEGTTWSAAVGSFVWGLIGVELEGIIRLIGRDKVFGYLYSLAE